MISLVAAILLLFCLLFLSLLSLLSKRYALWPVRIVPLFAGGGSLERRERVRTYGSRSTAAPESTPCPTLTTPPASLKALPLVLDTYEAAVRVCRGLSAQGV
jgi:hypothetical protein